jgi:MoaA/NifB/PqqE/SkfB family radical SAM enzyme
MCDAIMCPRIASGSLPNKEDVEDPYLKDVIKHRQTDLRKLPRHVKLAHDDSCNLSCPSCRDRIIVAKRERMAQLDAMLETAIMAFIRDCHTLDLSGDGDPFASKHYRDIIARSAELYPNLKINLHTNGVLMDDKSWDQLKLDHRVAGLLVSIDAATPATYEIVRRGGDFFRLQENLKNVIRKRQQGKLSRIEILFVVQTQNYHEMPEFVEMGKSLGVDAVAFSLIYHWDRGMNYEHYLRSKIWDASHPEHHRFLDVLKHPLLGDPIVSIGDVALYRDQKI